MLSLLNHYDTYKTVRFRDKKLGLLYWSLIVGTLLYIILYNVIVNKGYLEVDKHPLAAVRVRAVQPDNLTFIPGEYDYCRAHKCKVWDPVDAIYSSLGGDSRSLTVTTRITDIKQKRLCSDITQSCTQVFGSYSEQSYFLAGVDNFEFVVEHSVQASRFVQTEPKEKERYGGSHRHMKGVLMGHDDKPVMHFDALENSPDIIPLHTLLQSTETNLDDISDTRPLSMRQTGLVIQVVLYYTNMNNNWFGTSDTIQYEYKAHRMLETEYEVLEAIYTDHEHYETRNGVPPPDRTLRKRYGIHIRFITAGSIGRFSLFLLLLNVASALGLLNLSAIIVDFIALNFMQQKEIYFAHKYTYVDEQMCDKHSSKGEESGTYTRKRE